MIKVTIASTAVRHMSGIGKASGKEYSLHFQDAWFHTFDKDGVAAPFPQKVELILPKDKDGAALYHPAGVYELAPGSIYVDRNGKLAIEPVLLPFQKPPASVTPRVS